MIDDHGADKYKVDGQPQSQIESDGSFQVCRYMNKKRRESRFFCFVLRVVFIHKISPKVSVSVRYFRFLSLQLSLLSTDNTSPLLETFKTFPITERSDREISGFLHLLSSF